MSNKTILITICMKQQKYGFHNKLLLLVKQHFITALVCRLNR